MQKKIIRMIKTKKIHIKKKIKIYNNTTSIKKKTNKNNTKYVSK